MSMEDQRLIRKYLPTHYFIYDAGLAHVLGSINDALLMDNLIFWNGKGAKHGYVYKTVDEMYIETGLSENQQRAAIRRCIDKCILEQKLMGIPAKRHFKLHIKTLINLISTSEIINELDPKKSKISKLINERTNTESNQKLNKELSSIYRLYLSSNKLDEKRCRLTPKRAMLIIDRLEDVGYERVRKAVVNCAASELYNGSIDDLFKGNVEFIFKNYETTENLANLKEWS